MARGLSDQAVEDMANVNLHVLCFLGLSLEDDVPDHSELSRFRTKLTKEQAWDALLSEINRQIEGRNLMAKPGCHVDGSITHSPRKPKAKPTYEIVGDREERDDEADANADANGLVIAVETTPANRHDSQPLVDLVDKAGIEPGTRPHADKAYGSKQHQEALKTRGIYHQGTRKTASRIRGRQEQAAQPKAADPQQGHQQSTLCGKAHVWRSTALVQRKNSALPGLGQSPCLAHPAGRHSQPEKAAKALC